MPKAVAAILIVLALVAEVLFLASGAGAPLDPPNQLAQSLGPLAGAPFLAIAGGVAFVCGVLLLARPEPAAAFPVREVVLSFCVAGALAVSVAFVIGVVRAWSRPTLAVLALGGMAQTLGAVGIAVRLSVAKQRRRLLFVPSVVLTVLLAVFYVLVVVLGNS